MTVKNDRAMLPVVSPRARARKVFDLLTWRNGTLHISRHDGRDDDRAAVPSPAPDDLTGKIQKLFGGTR